MALDRAPWFVSTPGVHHSSEVARVMAYAATGGARGVIGFASLKVTASPVPNGEVQVAPGVAVAPSTYSGDVGQSYIMRGFSTSSIAVEPTGSSGGRTDLVVIRVDDVARVGQPPADPNDHDYTKLHVIQGGSMNQPFPFVPLARIVIPANTGTITSAMIQDVREVVLGREQTVVRTFAEIASGVNKSLLTSENAYPVGMYFPQKGGAIDQSVHRIDVPEWATQMEIRAEWLSVAMHRTTGNGRLWVTYDTTIRNDPAYMTQPFAWASEDTDGRQNWTVVDTVPVPASYRGKSVAFGMRANRNTPSSSTKQIWMDAFSGTALTVRFLERAD